MSHTGIKKPSKKKNPVPNISEVAPKSPNALGTDVDTLKSEYLKLDSMLAFVNETIQTANKEVVEAQQKIAAARERGLQIVGQASVIGRQLQGMGIEPTSLVPNLPNFNPDGVEIEDEMLEPEEFNPVSTLKNRFR